jgi:tripartite-type tricarboxylate transporter receptor subunit TctC
VPVKDLPGFIDYAKKNPNKLNLASVGIGSMGHVACEMLMAAAGISMVHIPYKGGAPAAQGMLAGEAQLMCDSISTSHPYVKEGRLKGVALMSDKRSSLVPEVPTATEAGLPGLVAYVWNGMFAPANTSPAITNKISDAMNSALKTPEFQDRMRTNGLEVVGGLPESFAKAIREDQDRWGPIIKAKGIVAQ